MKELHLIISEKEKNRKCMDCAWFKTNPIDLPDFGKCIINHRDVISSDHACANFEWKDGKVEGKASDICSKCKNGEVIVGKGVSNIVCEDPYDGMIKNLATDSDICYSMFEVRKEKEPFNLNMPREAIKAIAKLNNIISELEKEKSAHLEDIKRLDEDCKRIAEKNKRAEAHIKNLKHQLEETQRKMDSDSKINVKVVAKLLTERDKLKNENVSLNTINKDLAEDRKKLINYMRSLKIASENYLKEFTYEED